MGDAASMPARTVHRAEPEGGEGQARSAQVNEFISLRIFKDHGVYRSKAAGPNRTGGSRRY